MFKLSGRAFVRCAAVLLSSNGAAATSRIVGTARASVAARTLFGRSEGKNQSQSKILADASANVFELQGSHGYIRKKDAVGVVFSLIKKL